MHHAVDSLTPLSLPNFLLETHLEAGDFQVDSHDPFAEIEVAILKRRSRPHAEVSSGKPNTSRALA